MSNYINIARTSTILTPLNSGETIMCTTPPLSPPFEGAQILLLAFIQYTNVGNGTGVVLRFRRGPLVSSPLIVAGLTLATAVGAVINNSLQFLDSPGSMAGVQYTLTGQALSAAGDATGVQLLLLAMALA